MAPRPLRPSPKAPPALLSTPGLSLDSRRPSPPSDPRVDEHVGDGQAVWAREARVHEGSPGRRRGRTDRGLDRVRRGIVAAHVQGRQGQAEMSV